MRFLVSICISHTGISRCPIGQDKNYWSHSATNLDWWEEVHLTLRVRSIRLRFSKKTLCIQ